ncbi:HD-like signal output (HDOD) domain, no enzymatic activity [Desulfacinum hydrothermale DSM 13146]|uniref:HD-like signal output (HDOD) domain, no enzymatic activity n=1 Tax=Desulfacinum hydrothermale DSM 13146 TaxID=1121390 RepID=A0A1W1XV86_9BACT|nr:HDOD domain-containing protein [Desulfacinum hydrothermale]SMC27797.1 HD-like signal output (HDOD) domain, no enzymatic activity [Desulfacinum hydrothermale DSM 13146]
MDAQANLLTTADVRAAFKGLDEKEFINLYNFGQMRPLNTGEVLFREGEPGHSVAVLLKGRLRLVRRAGGSLHEVASLNPGDAVCDAPMLTPGHRLTSAVAAQPTLVLLFSESMFRALPPPTQLYLVKKLNDTHVHRLLHSEETEAVLAARCDYLSRYVRGSLVERTQDYSRSELIVGMLKKVPQLPMYASKLTQMLLDENASAKQVAALAKDDPSLVSAVLKRVNSPYYNWQKKISDFQHAVTLLGFNQVYQLVVSEGLRRTMPNTPPFRKLHNHSVVISHIAHEIALLSDRRQASAMSTLALLHDIGKSVILLLKRQNPKLSVLIDILDSSKIGALLLAEWNIPENVCRTVEMQDYAEFSPPEALPDDLQHGIALLHVAHQCAELIGGGSKAGGRSPFSDDYLRILRVPQKSVETLTTNQVRPALEKKAAALPEHVRAFLQGKNEDLGSERTAAR